MEDALPLDQHPNPDSQDQSASVLRAVLGDDPIEVGTAGELAKLMAQLPADTPLRVAEHVQVDPRLDAGRQEDATVAAVTAYTSTESQGVKLGAYVVPRGRPVPPVTVAFLPYERVIEAMWNGDAVGMVDGCRALVDDVAGWLARSDVTLLELADDDPDLQDQLEREADWLTAARDRLGLLQARFVALQQYKDEQGR
jgi:hypothetical protein